MSSDLKKNFKSAGLIGLFSGMAYGLSGGTLTLYSYHTLIPDIFIFPIYAAIFYGIMGLIGCLIFTTLISLLFYLFKKKLYLNLIFAANIGWLIAIFILFVKLDKSAIPGQLSFLKNIGPVGMCVFLVFTFIITMIAMLIANRLFLKGAYSKTKKWLFTLGILYVFEVVFFIAVNYFKYEKASDVARNSVSKNVFHNLATKVNDTKIFMIGVDGADWQILRTLADEGKVPNFASLMQKGVSGNLKTYRPTKSPVIWTTIGTGKTMSKHGVQDFVFREIPTVNTLFWNYYPLMFGTNEFLDIIGVDTFPVNNTVRKTKTFWNICNDMDISTGVIGWWPSWPADEVLGFIVSDRFMWDKVNETLTHNFGMTFPDSLADEINDKLISMGQFKQQSELLRFVDIDETEMDKVKSEIDSLQIGPMNKASTYSNDTLSTALSYLGWIYLRDQNKVNLGMYLHQKYQPQVHAIYLKGIDPMQHAFWRWTKPEDFPEIQQQNRSKFKDTVREYYIYTDEIIGELLSLTDENTIVIILSDHGFESTPHDGFWKSGGHDNPVEGIIILAGKNIKQNQQIENTTVLDITPTILYALGLPVGDDMDGKVLKDAFETDFFDANPIETIPTYDTYNFTKKQKPMSTKSDETIKEHLKTLGYIK